MEGEKLLIPAELFATEGNEKAAGLLWGYGPVEEFADVPLWGLLDDGTRLAEFCVSLCLLGDGLFLFALDLPVVVDHVPFLLYGEIGDVGEVSGAADVLEEGLYFLICVWTGEVEAVGVAVGAMGVVELGEMGMGGGGRV